MTTRVELVIGTTLAIGAVLALAYVFEEPPQPKPPPSPVPPNPDTPRGPAWAELGATLALVHGRRYRGCIEIAAPASWAITIAMVRARAEHEGFTDVRVTDERPSAWPPADCKWYVDATWAGADTLFHRPEVVTRAWWLVPG